MVAPPRSAILLNYEARFPDFIRQFKPAADLPYLADVAHRARPDGGYHAPEAAPIDPGAFMANAPDQLSTMRLVLHPSLRIVRSRFPALTIWQMNIAGGVPVPVDLASGGEDLVVVRPLVDVEVRSIPNGSLEFIQILADGRPVPAALEAALTANSHFDLSANLSDLLCAGALVGYRLAPAMSRTSPWSRRA